jgi:hypothetical protein
MQQAVNTRVPTVMLGTPWHGAPLSDQAPPDDVLPRVVALSAISIPQLLKLGITRAGRRLPDLGRNAISRANTASDRNPLIIKLMLA